MKRSSWFYDRRELQDLQKQINSEDFIVKQCAVKFCGGCNPRYDRGAAYRRIREETKDAAVFEIAEAGKHYDILLIIRGCTQCPYLYEEINADRRIICTSSDGVQDAIEETRK